MTTTPIPPASNRSREAGAGTWSDGVKRCTSRLGQVRGRNRLEDSQRNLEHLEFAGVSVGLKSWEKMLMLIQPLARKSEGNAAGEKDAENCSGVGVTVKVMGQCGGGQ